MADYKEAHGVRAKLVSSNPTNPTDGQLWYNSTDEALRYKKADSAGAWSTGGDMVNGRRLLAGSGTQTAGLAFGGSAVPTAYKSHTEEYNGSSPPKTNPAVDIPQAAASLFLLAKSLTSVHEEPFHNSVLVVLSVVA